MKISTTVLNAMANRVSGYHSLIQSDATYYNAQAVDNRLSVDRATLNTFNMDDYADGFAFLVTEAWGTDYYVVDNTYELDLSTDLGDVDVQNINFLTAVNGVIQLTNSVFFAVTNGTQVLGVTVTAPRYYPNAVTDGQFDRSDLLILEEGISPVETFSSNGTFTVNDIIITLSGL